MHTNIIMAIYDEDLKRYDNVQYLIAERMEPFFKNLCDSYEEQVERVERDSGKTQKVRRHSLMPPILFPQTVWYTPLRKYRVTSPMKDRLFLLSISIVDQ